MDNNPVLKTLIYESIFNFPLYGFEIWKFLINDKKIDKKTFAKLLKNKGVAYDKKTSLYYLINKKNSISRRLEAEKISADKLKLAQKIALALAKIPTIRLIGISGSLALGSSSKGDDIDLFIVCKKNTTWTTRLFSVILLKLMGAYRKNDNFKDKICLNMIVDNYSFPKDRRDLYTAFEITKLRPVFSKNNAHNELLRSNSWIGKFMPNFLSGIDKEKVENYNRNILISYFFSIINKMKFEKLAKNFQLSYMKRRTNEEVSDHLLAFHPRDFKKEIMTKFDMLIGSTRGH